MAKAEINLPNGTRISIDGTPEEIMKVHQSLSTEGEPKQKNQTIDRSRTIPKKKPDKIGPLGRIRTLIEDNYFKEKRVMDNVIKSLEEKAIFYKHSDVSPSLIRLVKKGELRRIKEGGKWMYVNP